MLVRFAIVWALLHIGCLIYEIIEYLKSKRWGLEWWLKYHAKGTTRVCILMDGIFLFSAVVYWIVYGFNFI